MPYPFHYSWQKWKMCPTCGLDWPISELQKDYTGKAKCPRCFDQRGFAESLLEVTTPRPAIFDSAATEEGFDKGVFS